MPKLDNVHWRASALPAGSCSSLEELPEEARAVVDQAPRAVLTTIDDDGRPHAVPVCFAVSGSHIFTAIDHKPKTTTSLARLRHIEARPFATVLVDRYDDDWSKLGWVMVRGRARIDHPGAAGSELEARYRQYRERPPEGPVIVIEPQRISWWLAQ